MTRCSPRPARTSPRRRAAALLIASVAVPITVLGVAAPADAHPFGDPQQLEIVPTSEGFDVRWQAAEDDLTSLALRLDVLEGPRAMVFKDGALVPGRTEDADAATLAASPVLGSYLVQRIELSVAGKACAGSLIEADDLAARGALLAYVCEDGAATAAKPAAVTVRARLLTDLHAAYKTMATGPGGATHVFTADSPSHDFSLSKAEGPTVAQSGTRMIAWALAGAASLLGLVAVTTKRRKWRAR